MTKAKIEKELFINEDSNDGSTSGYLRIKSSETVTLDYIKGIVFLEGRGRMSSFKDEVLSIEISNQKELIRNESYEMPFSFNSSDFDISSYAGKNVSFSYSFEVQMDVSDDDIRRVEKGIFSKVKSFVTSAHVIKDSKYFKVENKDSNYEVVEAETKFHLRSNTVVALLTLLFVGCTIAYLMPEFNPWYIVLGVVSTILLAFLITKIIGSSLGVISMKTMKDEYGFICKLVKTRKFELVNPSLYYDVIERVVDNRGTSSSTSTASIYTSEKKKFDNFRSSPEVKFSYPKRHGLHSFKYKDASILWQMNLQGHYFGLTLKYQCTFTVKRK